MKTLGPISHVFSLIFQTPQESCLHSNSTSKKYPTFHWAFFPFSQLPCHEVRIFSRLIRFWGQGWRSHFWQGGWLMGSCPIQLNVTCGFYMNQILRELLSKLGLGNQRNQNRIQRTFPVVRMMKMCWVPKAWYISRSSYKLYIQAALLSDMWQCHHHSLGILGLNQPYVIRTQKFPNKQPPSILFFSKIMSCFCRVDLPLEAEPSLPCMSCNFFERWEYFDETTA